MHRREVYRRAARRIHDPIRSDPIRRGDERELRARVCDPVTRGGEGGDFAELSDSSRDRGSRDRHRAGIPRLPEVAALCGAAYRSGSVHRANAARKQISEWSLMTRRALRMEMARRQRQGRRVQFRRLMPVL
jgi:hypothetical protein